MTNNLLLKNIIIGASTAALALSSLSAWADDAPTVSNNADAAVSAYPSGWVKASTTECQPALPPAQGPSTNPDAPGLHAPSPAMSAPQKPVSAPKTKSIDDQLKAQQKKWF